MVSQKIFFALWALSSSSVWSKNEVGGGGGGGGLFGPARFWKSDLEQCTVEWQDLQPFSLYYNIFGNN